jgi:hypothetical protein
LPAALRRPSADSALTVGAALAGLKVIYRFHYDIMLEWNSYSVVPRRYPFRYPDEIVAITRGRLEIEIEKTKVPVEGVGLGTTSPYSKT